jgi:tetratricopeptide (TPR) repeat protein
MAGQLRYHPAWTVADLAADLAEATDRLALMVAEQISVAAAFDLSYKNLRPGLQRLFRRLSLHPGADIGIYAAAALDGSDPVNTRRGLDDLFAYHLMNEPARGRYRFHDLIAEHARALAANDPPAERDGAEIRLLDYYLHTARAADRHLAGRTPTRMRPVITAPPAHAPKMLTWADAITWMEAEHLNLHAAVGYAATHGRPGHAVAITAAVGTFLRSRGHWNEARDMYDLTLKLARDVGDQPGRASILTDLGQLRYIAGDLRVAVADLTQATRLQRSLSDPLGEAHAIAMLGIVQQATGDYQDATANISSAQIL